MGRKLLFPGETYEIDLTVTVNQSRELSRYRDRLATARLKERPVGRAAAQEFVERVVERMFTVGSREFERGASPHLDAVLHLSEEIRRRYNRLLELFAPGAAEVSRLPIDLQPAELGRLMRELDRRLEDLEANASTKAAEDMLYHAEQTFSVEDLVAAERRAGEDLPVEERKPSLELDEPAGRTDRPARGEGDAAYRAAYNEQKRFAPENLVVRRMVQQDAQGLVEAGLFPPGTVPTVTRTQAWSQGIEAQLRRFSDLDPTFLGRGYEVQFRLPDGTQFRADGIRFTSPGRRRFQFLESKEPYTWTDRNFYNTVEGREQLRGMLHDHRGIAAGLRERGCDGFRYETGHPELDAFLASEIAGMRHDGLDGADLLSAPGLEGH